MKIRDFMKKTFGEVEPTPTSIEDDEYVTIPIVELFDENGSKLLFELLDSLEYYGEKYSLLTPYFEGQEEYEPLEEPADVFVMKELVDEKNEIFLETVEDEFILQAVYDLFKVKYGDEFEFKG